MDANALTILLVEDDEVDVEMVRRALGKLETEIPLRVARDGQEALTILRGGHDDPPLPMPHVILLDVNMPRMDGHTFLRELRNDVALRNRIVFMLTTSNSEMDRNRAYDKQVAGYFVKGREGTRYPNLIGVIERYCSGVAFPVSSLERPPLLA